VIVGGPQDCEFTVPGVRINDLGHRVVVDQFPPGARGPTTLLMCGDQVHHSSPTPALDDFYPVSLEVYDSSGALSEIVALCPERLECWPWGSGPDGPRLAAVCGDADWSGSIGVKDALIALRAAVSIEPCALTLCDADRDGSVKATDAMMILSAGVGLEVPLICPAPCKLPDEAIGLGEPTFKQLSAP